MAAGKFTSSAEREQSFGLPILSIRRDTQRRCTCCSRAWTSPLSPFGGPRKPGDHALYIEADLAMKKRALDKLADPKSRASRFVPSDPPLAFLVDLLLCAAGVRTATLANSDTAPTTLALRVKTA